MDIGSALKHDNEVKLIRSSINEVRDVIPTEISNIQGNLTTLGNFEKDKKTLTTLTSDLIDLEVMRPHIF